MKIIVTKGGLFYDPPTMDNEVKNERTKTYLFDLQNGFTEV